jgi:hypothetical protein
VNLPSQGHCERMRGVKQSLHQNDDEIATALRASQ